MPVERTPTDWMILPLRKYAQFSGRAPRAEYWWFFLAYTVVAVVTEVIDRAMGSEIGVLGAVTSIGLLIPTLAVTVRRLHDIGRSGWWMLGAIALAAVFGFEASQAALEGNTDSWEPSQISVASLMAFCVACLVVFVFTLIRGTKGPNRYGPDPYEQHGDLEPVLT